MIEYKDSEEPKIPKYELDVFKDHLSIKDHLYILYTFNNGITNGIFETESKAKIKMQLDLLGIDHFDRIQKHRPNLDGNICTYFSLFKYE